MRLLPTAVVLLSALSIVGCSATQPDPVRPAADEPALVDFVADVDFVCEQIEQTYAYWEELAVDWSAACTEARQRALRAPDADAFLALLEDLIEELADDHAHLGVNNEHSPRLVPSDAALWPRLEGETAVIEAVRPNSWAWRAGVRPGARLEAIDGLPPGDALAAHLPSHQRRDDPRLRAWALRRAITSTHDHAPKLTIDGEILARPLQEDDPETPRIEATTIEGPAGPVGHVRVGNALGDKATVEDFDRALDAHPEWTALVLDLRDTPSGGNSDVARGIMGRLIEQEQVYQRHELPAAAREGQPRRAWLELVAPRGQPFTGPVVVLVGRWTGSMGEGTAIGLQGMGRAELVGTPMAGLRGAVYDFELPESHWTVTFPVEALFRVDGTPRHEVVPDIEVDLVGADGHDVVLRVAVQSLGSSG